MKTSSRPPRGLATAPQLATLYVQWSNRNEKSPVERILGLGLIGAAVGVTWLVWLYRASVAAAFDNVQQHTFMIGLLAGIVTAVFVSHQRSVGTARAPGSWVAALPVSPRVRRIEALTLQLAPVFATLILLAGFGALAAATLIIAGFPAGACIVVLRSLLLGTLIGVAAGLAIPVSKALIPYPGSRYVPHRTIPTRGAVPSVAALGIWPIRRMFAMLRPKILARTVLPLLVMIPLGTTAAAAMVLVGLLGALMAFVFLLISVIWVMQAAGRWLRPLPLSSRRLARVVANRALIVMAGICALAAWLIWVRGL